MWSDRCKGNRPRKLASGDGAHLLTPLVETLAAVVVAVAVPVSAVDDRVAITLELPASEVNGASGVPGSLVLIPQGAGDFAPASRDATACPILHGLTVVVPEFRRLRGGGCGEQAGCEDGESKLRRGFQFHFHVGDFLFLFSPAHRSH